MLATGHSPSTCCTVLGWASKARVVPIASVSFSAAVVFWRTYVRTYAVGRRMFHDYLKSECSQENIQFWEACERFKLLFADDLPAEAKVIYNEFVRRNAEKQVRWTCECGSARQLVTRWGCRNLKQCFLL